MEGQAAVPAPRAPHKAEVHTQAAVDARTGQADEDAIRHGCPGRVFARAIEADLLEKKMEMGGDVSSRAQWTVL